MSITLKDLNTIESNYQNTTCISLKKDLYNFYKQKLNEYYSQPTKSHSCIQSYQNNNAYGSYTTGTGSINIGSTESFIGCYGNHIGIN